MIVEILCIHMTLNNHYSLRAFSNFCYRFLFHSLNILMFSLFIYCIAWLVIEEISIRVMSFYYSSCWDVNLQWPKSMQPMVLTEPVMVSKVNGPFMLSQLRSTFKIWRVILCRHRTGDSFIPVEIWPLQNKERCHWKWIGLLYVFMFSLLGLIVNHEQVWENCKYQGLTECPSNWLLLPAYIVCG